MSRSAIESDYEFGAYDDDYRGFDIRDDESNRGPLILALALGILVVFGAVVWNTYRQGVRTAENGLPVIAAADTNFKRTPEERGGAITPDLDRRIYDQMDGADRPLQSAALTPAQKQALPPLPGPVTLDGGPSAGKPQSDRIVLDQAQKLEGLRGGADVSDGADVASIQPVRAPAPAPTQRLEPLPAPPAEELISASRFAFADDGDYLVQISALRTRDAAERAWIEAKRKSPGLFDGGQKLIQRADLGSKGVFYRLRVGAFVGRPDAAEFCDALKSAQHQCIVVQN